MFLAKEVIKYVIKINKVSNKIDLVLIRNISKESVVVSVDAHFSLIYSLI